MPASQFCYISLPTFRSVQGDSVDKNNALEKIIWILANTGRKSALRSLPEWVESDPFIKSFVDTPLRYSQREEKFDHDVAETSGTEDNYRQNMRSLEPSWSNGSVAVNLARQRLRPIDH
ncbi:hypothetical protein KEM48_001043 [Puccinia striiformis f. sp. tritici PST-130]|nr:hypothetical protein KEM48_001043 [Puccinia striiformis f. sp. tritici PST-130]